MVVGMPKRAVKPSVAAAPMKFTITLRCTRSIDGFRRRQAAARFTKVLPVLASSSTSTMLRAPSSRPRSCSPSGMCRNWRGAWLCASSNSMMSPPPTR